MVSSSIAQATGASTRLLVMLVDVHRPGRPWWDGARARRGRRGHQGLGYPISMDQSAGKQCGTGWFRLASMLRRSQATASMSSPALGPFAGGS